MHTQTCKHVQFHDTPEKKKYSVESLNHPSFKEANSRNNN